MSLHRPAISLIACDVDGTLIGHDGILPPERAEAVARVLDAGIALVLATGKLWPSITGLYEQLDLSGPHVTCNGAAVVDRDQRLLQCTPLDSATAMTVVAELAGRDIPHAIYLDDGTLVTSSRVPALDILVELGEPEPTESSIGDRRVLKVLSVLAVEQEGDLRSFAADRARIQRTSHRFLEWNHPTADKAHGLRFVADHLGIPMDQVVAIGDAENDVPMLRAAGTGIAVSAASDAALQSADIHLISDLTDYLNEVASAALEPT